MMQVWPTFYFKRLMEKYKYDNSLLPPHVHTNWFLLHMALFDEFGEGYVMRSLKRLCKEWWQVPDFKQALDKAWKVYEQVSFFRQDFFAVLEVHDVGDACSSAT